MKREKTIELRLRLHPKQHLLMEAYGAVMGMSVEDMALHLLRRQIGDIICSGVLGKADESMKLAKRIVKNG